MPVFNGAEFIQDSISSVLGQTYNNIQLIVINDGSTDDTDAIVRSFSDPRIRYLFKSNSGVAMALDAGLDAADGTLIARQDADDISDPFRIAVQVSRFAAQADLKLLGSQSRIIRGIDFKPEGHMFPASNAVLQFLGRFDNLFVGSSTMFYRQDAISVGGFKSDYKDQLPEDFFMWLRLMDLGIVGNIPRPLVIYREHQSGLSSLRSGVMSKNGLSMAVDSILKYLPNYRRQDVELAVRVVRGYVIPIRSLRYYSSVRNVISDLAAAVIRRFPNEAIEVSKFSTAMQRRMLLNRCRVQRLVADGRTTSPLAQTLDALV